MTLTEEQRKRVYALRVEQKLTVKQLAERFGVSRSGIRRVLEKCHRERKEVS